MGQFSRRTLGQSNFRAKSRYFRLNGYGCFLSMSPPNWARYGETPLWMFAQLIGKNDWLNPDWIQQRLVTAYAGTSTKIFLDEQRRCTIAISLPIGAEQAEVIQTVVRQVVAIIGHLGAPPIDVATLPA